MRRLDYAEVMELYDMRAVLEATAARLAARAASDLEIDELAALNADLAQAGVGADAYRINRQFHDALRARDAAAAEAAMRTHIEAAHRARLRKLREIPAREEEQ